MSPRQAAIRLRRFVDRLPAELEKSGRAGLKLWSGRAVGTYMRDAKGEGQRDPEDSGPLRILTGGYSRNLTSGRGGAINRVEVDADGATLTLGADPDELPQVYNELGTDKGFGRGITVPARPTIKPALEDELGEITSLFQKRTARLLKSTLRASAGGVA